MKISNMSNIPSPPSERFLASLNSTTASSSSPNNTAATSAALFATVVFVGVLITVAVSCVIQFVIGVKESKKSDRKREVRRETERRTTVSSTENILLSSTSSPIQSVHVPLPESSNRRAPPAATPSDQYYHSNYNDAPRLEELPKTASPDDVNYDIARRAAEARRKAAFQAARQLDDITNGRAHTARAGPWSGRRSRHCGPSKNHELARDEHTRYVSSL